MPSDLGDLIALDAEVRATAEDVVRLLAR
jgi:hypothetical protein